jgi:small subunit ribosomal protein S6
MFLLVAAAPNDMHAATRAVLAALVADAIVADPAEAKTLPVAGLSRQFDARGQTDLESSQPRRRGASHAGREPAGHQRHAIPVTYDLLLLLDMTAPEQQKAKVRGEVEHIISELGAAIVSKRDWGARRAAFEIKHKKDAEHHLLQFVGGPEVPAALGRYLRITDGVVRFRVIKLRPGHAIPDLRQADAQQPDTPSGAEGAPHRRR